MAIEITYDGKPALTTAQAAQRYGLSPSVMRMAITRLKVAALPERLDGRTPLYSAEQLDQAMESRPGRGAHLRKSPTTPTA